ncbi:MAG: DNA adenine methylase [Stellaceae bacterium]
MAKHHETWGNARGPFPWIGGKTMLADQLIAVMPQHQVYCEPFAGAANVFFRKPQVRFEVLNDLDGDVANFFRVAQNHREELLRTIRFAVPARAEFDRLRAICPEHLTDIQRAARFFYLLKTSFGARRNGISFAFHAQRAISSAAVQALIEAAHERLARVTIENRPYAEVIRRVDRREALFYVDPPYRGSTPYEMNFGDADYLALAKLLAGIKGKFILSLNDQPWLRKVFAAFRQRRVRNRYSILHRLEVAELAISNFPMRLGEAI